MKRLPKEAYTEVVRNTPLVSIDLLIEDINGKILLGYRLNRPAKNSWFVPGGVIRKNENFIEAYQRISKDELGIEIDFSESSYVGLYEHIYDDNFADDASFNTHYIVNAFHIKINLANIELPKAQHSDYWWATKEELLAHDAVHTNTKNYFNGYKAFSNTKKVDLEVSI